ncbi:MAG TPA: ABC transporter substrate-binding protein [Acidimicrobiia bacterium]|nr:ABC transporter substrate-binding protein [Acidimicrobiia bacterium]
MRQRWLIAITALAVVLTACGQAEPADTTAGEAGGTTMAPDDTSPTTMAPDGAPATTAAPTGGDYCDGREGELIWAHEQEPPDMHLNDPNNNLSITSYIWQALWEDLYGVTNDIGFYPELLAEEATVSENGDGSVTISHRLRDGLTWSDGEPLTSDDVEFTYEVLMDGYDPDSGGGTYLITSRQGYDQITDFNVISPTEFEITYEPFFAGWKSLFTNVFPAHAFGDDADADTVNEMQRTWTGANGAPLPSSGPMVFESWDQGVSMHLVRNDRYHGSISPEAVNRGPACVSGVRINWVADTDAQVNSLKAGEAHVVFTQPQLAFEEISGDDAFTVAASPGPIYEHWGINLLNPHLAKPEVREALAFALDKAQVIETLYAPILGDVLDPAGLGNTMWMANQPVYEDHQTPEGYGLGDVESARAALESAGYSAESDGIYAHPDDGRLTLRVGTTGGNALRELQQQIIQAQMKEAGIEITIDNVPGSDYFTNRPFSADNLLASASGGELGDPNLVDIMQFAWVGGPWPGGQLSSYLSGGIVEDAEGNPVPATGNPYGFRNETFDALAAQCNATIDDEERAACYNEVDTYVTTLGPDPDQGLFMLPITQKPDFFAYSNQALAKGAVAPDANTAGPLANVVDFVLR